MPSPFNNNHLQWLNHIKTLNSSDGIPIEIFEFQHVDDDSILDAWAKHFRNHYCLDTDIDDLRDGTGKSRKDFLNDYKFPSKTIRPGPATRSGDFGEILISDYLEYRLNYWVPRTRFYDRQNKNSPTQGVDVMGLKILDIDNESPEDELIIYEVKAKLTTNTIDESKKRLEIAIEHSEKDFELRKGESLNAFKQWYRVRSKQTEVKRIKRFQNPTDKPYKELSGAASIILDSSINDSRINKVNASAHPNSENLQLIIISGNDLMELVHSLYERAANEA